MEKTLLRIQELEREIYPVQFQVLQDCQTWKDLQEYCAANKIDTHLWEDGYLIMTNKEIIDLASKTVLSLHDLLVILNIMKGKFKTRSFSLDARLTTSYPLIKIAEKRKKIMILSDTPWSWGGEIFHEIVLRFL